MIWGLLLWVMESFRSKFRVGALVLLFVSAGITALYGLLRPISSGCIMTYMYPTYIPISTPANVSSDRYGLFLYHEGWKKIDFAEHLKQLSGVPVLFIPGNGGSYKQVKLLFRKVFIWRRCWAPWFRKMCTWLCYLSHFYVWVCAYAYVALIFYVLSLCTCLHSIDTSGGWFIVLLFRPLCFCCFPRSVWVKDLTKGSNEKLSLSLLFLCIRVTYKSILLHLNLASYFIYYKVSNITRVRTHTYICVCVRRLWCIKVNNKSK